MEEYRRGIMSKRLRLKFSGEGIEMSKIQENRKWMMFRKDPIRLGKPKAPYYLIPNDAKLEGL